GHGNPFGVPTAPWKRLRLSHFPTSHIYIQIGHFYFAQNRTFLFWVDTFRQQKYQAQALNLPIAGDHDRFGRNSFLSNPGATWLI
ncbi:MAG: hypothetical protein MUP71_09100, partial [Candidatus Aminicenantes bacterium]|nr:hypothetical protein [Candidatus Aminicenantes bacterium]